MHSHVARRYAYMRTNLLFSYACPRPLINFIKTSVLVKGLFESSSHAFYHAPRNADFGYFPCLRDRHLYIIVQFSTSICDLQVRKGTVWGSFEDFTGFGEKEQVC